MTYPERPRRALLFLAAIFAACEPGYEPPLSPASAAPSRTGAADVCAALRSSAAPPVVQPAGKAVRILAFGDFGSGSPHQMRVAAAMRRYAADHPVDFGITLGDNFYPSGLASPSDRRWIRRWETPYGPLGIRFYATLGNHDYRDSASPAGEMERSRYSRSWCLPRRFYTYTAGPAQLFALDTVPIENGAASAERQLDWLRQALRQSRSRWKIVYGHHPVYTAGEHGGRVGYLPRLKERLLPILKERKVDLYLAGHEHDLEVLKPEGGVVFAVSGGGGKDLRPLESNRCQAWAASAYGFTVLEAAGEELAVRFFDAEGRRLYDLSWKKGRPPPDCSR
jgi:hypothetical protein